jgi:hypothetical protein
MVAAMALATVSAGFSIVGSAAVFIGATVPVIGMGVAAQLGKLSAVACLAAVTAIGRKRRSSSPTRSWGAEHGSVPTAFSPRRIYRACGRGRDCGLPLERPTSTRGLQVWAGVVADLGRRIAQIDSTIETATQRGRQWGHQTRRGAAQVSRWTRYCSQRTREANTLADLKVAKAGIGGERCVVEADLGPVRDLATLLAAGVQGVLRWFILVVAATARPCRSAAIARGVVSATLIYGENYRPALHRRRGL